MKKNLLIGDSITEYNPLRHSDIENIGKSGATTENILKILDKTTGKYNKAFVMAGVNDINHEIDTLKILKNYNEIIEKCKNIAEEVFIISTLPTRLVYTNSFIDNLNKRLIFTAEDAKVNFIDCYDAFLDNTKLLGENLSTDNIHLSEEGYILLNSFISKYLYEKEKMQSVKDRFLEYIKWETTSSEMSKKTPSTIGQLFFANFLKEELLAIGMEKVEIDQYGYLTASIPSNSEKELKTLAFIAHLDTAPDTSGKGVRGKCHSNYNGEDLVLNKHITLSPKDFEVLNNYKGMEIITAEGETLLGGDDKGGIAEIITAMDYLIKHPEIKHGEIKVAFTPDEEIGNGCKDFDIEKFGAHYAYTLDGGELGELEFENFNAASLTLNIKGLNIHPGNAKDKMVHAGQIAIEFENMMPVEQKPQFTEGYEGFIMLTSIIGGVEDAKVQYIIRDHDMKKFEEKKELVKNAIKFLQKKYPASQIKYTLEDSYYNMREKIEPCMFLIDIAKEAMVEKGITPIVKPIRGGTDGARLSYMGLPCPNIFTGGHNFHGKHEFIVKESMEKAVEVVISIVEKFEKL
jgi:tripeptide aminopeptidase